MALAGAGQCSAVAVALGAEATRALLGGSDVYVVVVLIGRVPLGAPLACVRSVDAALQNSECTGCLPLSAMAWCAEEESATTVVQSG